MIITIVTKIAKINTKSRFKQIFIMSINTNTFMYISVVLV